MQNQISNVKHETDVQPIQGMEGLTKAIKTLKDAEMALWVACHYDCGRITSIQWERLQKVVMASEDTELVFRFLCQEVSPFELSAYEEYFLKYSDEKHLYLIARDYPNANVSKIEQVIKESNDNDLILSFAKDIKGADVCGLAESIINNGDVDYMTLAAIDLVEARSELLRGIVSKLDAYKMYNAMLVLQDTGEFSDYENNILVNGIILSGDVYVAIEYARDERRHHSERLQEFVCAAGKAQDIYRFAKEVSWADKDYLEEVIIQEEDFIYMAYFGADIPGADKRKIWQAIKNSKSNQDFKEAKKVLGLSRFFG